MRLLTPILLTASAWAATGDISNVNIIKDTCTTGITCNGWALGFTVAGMATGGGYSFGLGTNNNPSTAKVTLTVTRLGYDNTGNATTYVQKVYGVPGVNGSAQAMGIRLAYPSNGTNDETTSGSDVIVRVALSEMIYSSDTVTAVISSGVYTKSAVPNNSFSGSVTNNSTQAYPSGQGRWVTVPYQRVTGDFTIEMTGFHRFARIGRPWAAVVFTCADTHSHTVTSTVTNMTISGTSTDQHPVLVYSYLVPVSTLTQGDQLTCNFKAYPWIGNSAATLDSSSTVGAVDLTVKNAGGLLYAANDTGTISGCSGNAPTYKVLTVTGGAVTTFSLTYSGTGCSTATGAATATGGAQPGIGTGFTINTTVYTGQPGTEKLGPAKFLNDKSLTYGLAFAVIDPTNGHNSALSTWVLSTQAAAEAAYVSSTGNSYTTIGNAVQACKAFNNSNYSRNEPGGCTVLLATNANTYPGTTPGSTTGTSSSWFTISRLSTVTRANAAINVGTAADLKTDLVRINDISLLGSGTFLLDGGTGTASTGSKVWSDNVTINFTGTEPFILWAVGYATANTLTACPTATCFNSSSVNRCPFALVRGNAASSASSGVAPLATQYAVVGNSNVRPQYQTTANTFGNATSDGSIVAFNSILNWTSQLLNNDTAQIDFGVAIIQNVFERVSSNVSPIAEVSDNSAANAYNFLFWGNTMMGARIDQMYNYTGVNAPLYFWNLQYALNIFENYNYNGDTSAPADATHYGNMAVDYAVSHTSNYKFSSQSNTWPGFQGVFLGLYTPPIGGTLGFVNDASFNDVSGGGSGLGNGNYRLKSTSSARNLANAAACVLPYDFQGQLRNCSGLGSAGAYEQAIVLTQVFGW